MKILCVGAHPDDIEIGCGGTLAQLLKEGGQATYVLATRGEMGDQAMDPEELGQVREAEARAAAQVLGVSDVRFLGLPDGLTGYEPEHKVALMGIIREVRPDVVFTHARQDHFPDHALVGRVTREACLGAKGPWFPGAKGEPWSVKEILGYEVWNPLNTFQKAVEVSAGFPKKLEALQCFPSQMKNIPYHEAFEGLARYRGVMSGVGRLAEVFEVGLTS